MTDAMRRTPRTGRGEQTREAVLDAAREVFWAKGYVATRVADIAAHAGVSHGTFYTYFDSKDDVVWAIAVDLHEATTSVGRGTRAEAEGDEILAIELANRRYLEFYLANSQALRLMEEVAIIHPAMRKARRATRATFVERIERSLQRLQRAGQCDPALDATTTAHALVSMVSHFASHMVSSGTRFDVEVAVDSLTTLWARGIGLEVARLREARSTPTSTSTASAKT